MAAKAPQPLHHQLRVEDLTAEEAILEEWLLADGRLRHSRLRLDRAGRLRSRTPLAVPGELRAPPPRPSASPTEAETSWPLSLGRHRLEQTQVEGRWRITLAEEDGTEVVVATLPTVEGLRTGALRIGPGRSPVLATLEWQAGAPGTRVEGVEILDLRRARAALQVQRGLIHHQAGHHHLSREFFRHARDLDPELPEAVYDLACAEALLGESEEAMRLLARAFALSPDRLRGVAEEDEDLASLRERPDWRPLLRGPR